MVDSTHHTEQKNLSEGRSKSKIQLFVRYKQFCIITDLLASLCDVKTYLNVYKPRSDSILIYTL